MSRNRIFPPIKVNSALGGWLYTDSNQKIFDATSSWWCKHLGHRHPKIMEAIAKQSEQYIHAIGANTYSEAIKDLSNKLSNLYPDLNKVSYASDGSCAVEIALKMSFHTRKILREHDPRRKILKLSGAYHGETILALSVSDCDMYKGNYKDILIETLTCPITATCQGVLDPIWHDSELLWQKLEPLLEQFSKQTSVIIIEPLLQAANCMHIYSADWLKRLMQWARSNDIDIILDEIMTGFWRTGKLMAVDYTGLVPDFICLGKGLSAGSLPLSAVLASDQRFNACYPSNDSEEQPFLHSHTYSTHALAAAAANAALSIYLSKEIAQDISNLSLLLADCLDHKKLKNQRNLGCVVAAELKNPMDPAILQKTAAKNGILIRPLGDTIYICPPLNTSKQEVDYIKQAIDATIDSL